MNNLFNCCLHSQNKLFHRVIIIALFIVIASAAFITRTYDCDREQAKYPEFMPFTLECAMMYAYSYDIARNGLLPDYDSSLVGMKEVPTSSQMSISLEYFLGWGFRLKETLSSIFTEHKADYQPNDKNFNINTDFVNFLRAQLRIWISLSAGMIFLWLLLLDTSLLFSFLGGLLFAVTPAAIARATGQDIIRENFAIPLIMTAFVLYYYFLKHPYKLKLLLLAVIIYLSIISWDMTILCLSLWGIYELIVSFFADTLKKEKLKAWLVIFIVCLIGGTFSIYLFSHNFLLSPLVAIILPSLIISLWIADKPLKIRFTSISVIIVIFALLWFLILKNFGFSENYSHFYSLILTKIKFLNVQPVDPSLLDFDARILWTPALHSSTFLIYWRLFHFIVPLFALLLVLVLSLKSTRISLNLNSFLPIVFSIFFFGLFIMMVRFHALAIPYICISIAILGERLSERFLWLRSILTALFCGLIAMEVHFFLNLQRVYDDDYKAQLALIKELNHGGIDNKIVLADFTLSPMLKAYCGAKIILQPKFELKDARDAVEKYLNIMFHGNEQELMNFCKKYRADYFIFDSAMMNGSKKEYLLHPWSARYIADARIVEETAPVYLFFYEPEKLTYFYKLDGQDTFNQNRFEIYKVIYPEDITNSEKLFEEARKSKGDEAKKLIEKAFKYNPMSKDIRYLYYQLYEHTWPEYALEKR